VRFKYSTDVCLCYVIPRNKISLPRHLILYYSVMSVHTTVYLLLICGLLMITIADLEDIQHAGHVHTAHEVDGKHNVEFDHEAILGVFCVGLRF